MWRQSATSFDLNAVEDDDAAELLVEKVVAMREVARGWARTAPPATAEAAAIGALLADWPAPDALREMGRDKYRLYSGHLLTASNDAPE